ncbi:MAG: hypothetical protein U5K54_21895 [Cytophagales bacterium]|nr:hypothetical protein [Cytophagales bacterium]
MVTYQEAQAIIQASWNWPFSRKDMGKVYIRNGDLPLTDKSDKE